MIHVGEWGSVPRDVEQAGYNILLITFNVSQETLIPFIKILILASCSFPLLRHHQLTCMCFLFFRLTSARVPWYDPQRVHIMTHALAMKLSSPPDLITRFYNRCECTPWSTATILLPSMAWKVDRLEMGSHGREGLWLGRHRTAA